MADLRDTSDERLDGQLELWRAYRRSGRLANALALPDPVRDLATTVAETFGWTDERASAAAPSMTVPGGPQSLGGPGGLFQLAEALGRGRIGTQIAIDAATELGVGDDDIMFLVGFASKDSRHGDSSTAGAMMLLAGQTVRDDALAGRLLRFLAALTEEPNEQFRLLSQADARLAGGADDRLRAEVWNELAILLVGSGKIDEGHDLAVKARRLALETGDPLIAAMALGNQAVALMQAHKFRQAIDVLEALAKEQERSGDEPGLQVTRENLEICHNYL